MTKVRDTLSVFNRGLISKRAQARTDLDRVAFSAEEQTNWMPQRMGPMSLRNGLGYEGNTYNDAAGVYIPFQFQFNDTALLEMTSGIMRVWDEGETLVTRQDVSASFTNGTFDSDVSSWTDDDESGATSSWATGGYLQLLGNGYQEAKRYQEITSDTETIEHGLRIVIERGPVYLRIGSAVGGDDIFRQAILRTGTHSIAFTPGVRTFYVEFASPLKYPTLVDSVAFEASGNLELPTPWTSNLHCLRTETVGDVIFCACDGAHPQRIERRPNNSWSVVQYESTDGPWLGPSGDGTRLTPGALTGSTTITASKNLFNSTMVGQLIRIVSQGQEVEADLSAEDTYTDAIRVTGTDTGRVISVVRAGTWVGGLRLQRSIGEEGSWVNVATYTGNGTVNYDDGLDNVVAFYRIGFVTGTYTSGTAEVSLDLATGSITGTARITAYTSATSVTVNVLNDLGGTAATEFWELGAWSEENGYPTSVAYYEGRIWWFGRGRIWGTVSDALTSFDPDVEGDSGPIDRAIGKGAVDVVNWALPLQRLLIGSAEGEHSLRSSSFDEILTPTNFNVKESSTQGSSGTSAIRFDRKAVFIQKSGRRVYEMDLEGNGLEYVPMDLTALVPDLGEESAFTRIAIQRQPETRIYFTRADGKVAVLVRDKAEDVLAWIVLETDGEVEDIAVLPSAGEDNVFMIVKRTINGSTVRLHEKMALDTECRGGTVCKLVDAGVTYSGTPTTRVQAAHLPSTEVIIWADGKDLGTYTTDSSGDVYLSEAVSDYIVGLPYRARYKSTKLTAETPVGSSMVQLSKIDHLGLVLADTHYQGITYGPDFDTLDNLPLIHNGTTVAADTVWDTVDIEMTEFDGDWGQDTRICIEANAPRPATVMALVGNHDRQDKAIR